MNDEMIAQAADDVIERIQELPSPKDAIRALLVAHIRLTMDDGMGTEEISQMLNEYKAKFLTAIFELKVQ